MQLVFGDAAATFVCFALVGGIAYEVVDDFGGIVEGYFGCDAELSRDAACLKRVF